MLPVRPVTYSRPRRKSCIEGLRNMRCYWTARPVLLGLALWPLVVWGQKPVISPGGVVNAASYSAVGSHGVAGGLIATIFGTNLATSTQTTTSVPLPTSLGGTTVTVNGVGAPLLYVSPNQINFQVPSPWLQITPVETGLVVKTAAGVSDPYP